MYESGYSLRIFRILENDVVDFLTNIPLEYYLGDKRKEIFSPRLAELLIRIGSQIDIFFRNWDIVHSRNIGVDVDNLRIGNYKSIEKICKLSNKKVKVLGTGEISIPFKDWNKWKIQDENWWNAYNHIKHNGFYYKEEGNLNNVIESLSALFLLNCINKETTLKLIEYGYYNFNPDEIRELERQIKEIKKYGGRCIPPAPRRSQLFEYEETPSTPSLDKF